MFSVLYLTIWVIFIKCILICKCIFVFIGCVFILWYFVLQVFLCFSILVMFFKCILICECICCFCLHLLCVYSLILCTSDFFVFFNFSNVLWGYLNLWACSFVLVFVEEVLFRLAVFSKNLLAGDVHYRVALDRHVSGQAASPYSLEAYSGHLPAHLRPEAIAALSYYWEMTGKHLRVTISRILNRF